MSTTPLLDEQERMVGSVHVARDITERRGLREWSVRVWSVTVLSLM